jgi:hypothetical protein
MSEIQKDLDNLRTQVEEFDKVPHHVLVLMLSRISLWNMVHPDLLKTMLQMNSSISKEDYERWKHA